MKSKYRLCKLGDFISEISVRNNKNEVREVYSVTNSGGFVKSTDYFDKEVFSKNISTYKIVYPKQFAYNPSRINVGSVALLQTEFEVVVSPLYVVFECHGSLLPEYLLRYLKSFIGIRQIKNRTRGAVREILSFNNLAQIDIPIPPIQEQQKIVKLLLDLESVHAKRDRSILLLGGLLRNTFLKMFHPFSAYKIIPLDEVAEVMSGLTKGKDYSGKNARLVPYMRVANVQDGFLDLSDIKNILATNEEIIRYNLEDGDLLLTEGGDPDKLGRGGIWKGGIKDCIFQNHIFRVRVNDKNVINPTFLSYQTASTYGKSFFLKSAKQTTGIASINSTQLKRFPVFVAPIDLQNSFAKIAEQAERVSDQYKRSLSYIQELNVSISNKAFKGQLDLSDIEIDDPEYRKKDNEYEQRIEEQINKGYSLSSILKIFFKNKVFSYEELAEKVQASLGNDEVYDYEELKAQIFSALRGDAYFKLEQVFDEQKRKILLQLGNEAN